MSEVLYEWSLSSPFEQALLIFFKKLVVREKMIFELLFYLFIPPKRTIPSFNANKK